MLPCHGRLTDTSRIPNPAMDSLAAEWLNLALRWIHVIAAIMWIGDSFLFMWMDSSLTPPTGTSGAGAAALPARGSGA